MLVRNRCSQLLSQLHNDSRSQKRVPLTINGWSAALGKQEWVCAAWVCIPRLATWHPKPAGTATELGDHTLATSFFHFDMLYMAMETSDAACFSRVEPAIERFELCRALVQSSFGHVAVWRRFIVFASKPEVVLVWWALPLMVVIAAGECAHGPCGRRRRPQSSHVNHLQPDTRLLDAQLCNHRRFGMSAADRCSVVCTPWKHVLLLLLAYNIHQCNHNRCDVSAVGHCPFVLSHKDAAWKVAFLLLTYTASEDVVCPLLALILLCWHACSIIYSICVWDNSQSMFSSPSSDWFDSIFSLRIKHLQMITLMKQPSHFRLACSLSTIMLSE